MQHNYSIKLEEVNVLYDNHTILMKDFLKQLLGKAYDKEFRLLKDKYEYVSYGDLQSICEELMKLYKRYSKRKAIDNIQKIL